MLFAITGVPILLTGAALVGLPILLHLIMKQEPKRISFPAFRFLKQRRQINQRKIRLRHFLLLAMRMALIALICLSLFQPTIISEGISLRGDRPVAAVIVLDTSPSMGYVLSDRSGLTEARQRGLRLMGEQAEGPWTCLDEARGRALEILEDLPSASRVAIIDSAERTPFWSNNLQEARDRVRNIKKPRANGQPVTRALESAYDLLAKVDADNEPGQDPFPRLLVTFSDRTVPSWDSTRVPELISARDRVPQPSITHVFIDVGLDKTVNTGITAVGLRPQIIPANQPVNIDVTVEATAGARENILVFSVNGEEQRLSVAPTPDKPISRQFRKEGLKPGLYQARLFLLTPDGLPFDNEHFVTFRVREPRQLLVVVDPPALGLMTGGLGYDLATSDRAAIWKLALEATRWYSVDVRTTQDLMSGKVDLAKYAQVTLMGLARPERAIWEAVDQYVQNKGKLIVVPGGPEMDPNAYQTDAALKVLPGKFSRWVGVGAKGDPKGVTWTWRSLSELRPMLRKFREYQGQTDYFDVLPPTATGHWQTTNVPPDRVVVAYNDAADPAARTPAVMALNTGAERDSVLQFTVPLGSGGERFHNYASDWFIHVLVNEAVRSMTGDAEDADFNHTNGEIVPARWPAGDAKANYYLSGPDVSATDAALKRQGDNANIYLRGEKTIAAGNFMVSDETNTWSDGFSLNPPATESNLTRLEAKEIEAVFGPDTVFPANKKLALSEILSGKFTQPIELFPFLMILLLLVMALENLLANKFYRRKK